MHACCLFHGPGLFEQRVYPSMAQGDQWLNGQEWLFGYWPPPQSTLCVAFTEPRLGARDLEQA